MPVNTRQNHGMQNALEALEEIVQQNGLARSWEDEGLGTTVTLTIRRDEYLILYQAVCSWKDGTKKDVHHNLAQNFVTWWRCIFEILGRLLTLQQVGTSVEHLCSRGFFESFRQTL